MVRCSKFQHVSREDAGKQIRDLKKSGAWDGLPIRTYFCRYCRAWHIGHYEKPAPQTTEGK